MGTYVGRWTAPTELTVAFVVTVGPVVPLAAGAAAEPEAVVGLADVPQATNNRGMLAAPSIPSRINERLLIVVVVFARLRTTCTPGSPIIVLDSGQSSTVRRTSDQDL
jgi:hypothetical protein